MRDLKYMAMASGLHRIGAQRRSAAGAPRGGEPMLRAGWICFALVLLQATPALGGAEKWLNAQARGEFKGRTRSRARAGRLPWMRPKGHETRVMIRRAGELFRLEQKDGAAGTPDDLQTGKVVRAKRLDDGRVELRVHFGGEAYLQEQAGGFGWFVPWQDKAIDCHATYTFGPDGELTVRRHTETRRGKVRWGRLALAAGLSLFMFDFGLLGFIAEVPFSKKLFEEGTDELKAK
jgi:hypothetical protein